MLCAPIIPSLLTATRILALLRKARVCKVDTIAKFILVMDNRFERETRLQSRASKKTCDFRV